MIAPGELILAIDQGTRSTRALLFDARGRQQAMAQCKVDLQVLDAGRVEQSPQQLLDSLQEVVAALLHHPGIEPARIRHAGLATQRSSVLAWRRDNGAALGPVLSWQDRRASAALQALAGQGAAVRRITGLRLSPHYGAGKLQWLLANRPDVVAALESDNLVMGPLAGYLQRHLLADSAACVDHANASRTLLWNLETRDWDGSLLRLFGIPRSVLPDCRPIQHDYGRIKGAAVALRAANGDQTAALYAHGRPPPNTAMVNIGTGAFVLLPVGAAHGCPEGLLAGISRSDADSADYYAEGTVNGAAAALDWAARRHGLQGWSQRLAAWLEQTSHPPVFLNSVGGLGAPWWRQGPEPCFLEPPDSPAAAMAGVAESILFLVQANLDLLRGMAPAMQAIRISGGLARVDRLCRKLANLSGLPVQRPAQTEATARGIAWLAAGCPPGWSQEAAGQTFRPRQDDGLQARYRTFLDALGETLG